MEAAKMKKICSAVITLTTLAGALCGCFPTGTLEKWGGEYEKVLEKAADIKNLSLNLDIPEETPKAIPTLYTGLKEWEPYVIHEAFLDEEITEHFEYNGNYFPKEKRYVDLTSSNMICYEHGCVFDSVFFDDIKDKAVPRKFACSYTFERNLNFTDYDKELSLFSRKEALARADKLLEQLGITNVGEPIVYPITKEYAAKIAQCSVEETEWSDEDEVYYIIYPIRYGDIDLLQYDINILGAEYYNETRSYVSVTMTFDKLIEFDCKFYSDNYSFSDNSEEIISASKAAEILVDYFAAIENLEKTEFTSVKLVYAPAGLHNVGFVYEPAWLFEGVKTFNINGELFPQKTCELIFAKTGVRAANYG